MAVLAGAQRVECCLFGNGERTGNVDAVMDGDIDEFIFAYLKAASRGELQDA